MVAPLESSRRPRKLTPSSLFFRNVAGSYCRMPRLLVFSFAALLLLQSIHAQSPTASPQNYPPLNIGDPAPPLHIRAWVKGAPVAAFEKGKIYVIDFWSTWCVPCLATMPHTTELQKKFAGKDVIVLGVTSTDKFGNSEDSIRKMVEKKGDLIGFRIGIDDEGTSAKGYQGVFKGRTVEAYLGGASVPAIPATFVIDRESRIAFIGHPLEIEDVITKCIDGTWDFDAARVQRTARLEGQQLLGQLEKEIASGSFDAALTLCRRLVDELPHRESRIFAAVAGMMSDKDAPLVKRDPDLALRAGRQAVELTKGTDPGALSVLASVQFARGETKEAIETMTRAVAQSEGGMKPVLEKKLAEFKAAPAKP
jgi:thiol-disulfide isomerase/thioredoxin